MSAIARHNPSTRDVHALCRTVVFFCTLVTDNILAYVHRYRWGAATFRQLAASFFDENAVRKISSDGSSHSIIVPRAHVVRAFTKGAIGWEKHSAILKNASLIPLQVDESTNADDTATATSTTNDVVIVLDEIALDTVPFALVLAPTHEHATHSFCWGLAGVPIWGRVGWLPQTHLAIVKVSIPLWQMKMSRVEPRNVCVEAELSFLAARAHISADGGVMSLV